MKWPWCSHRWEQIGVQPLEFVIFSKKTGQHIQSGNPSTVILERCTICKTNRTREIKGHWTLEQLKA
jgi:hypothetical protein